jgi:hypothetical protein
MRLVYRRELWFGVTLRRWKRVERETILDGTQSVKFNLYPPGIYRIEPIDRSNGDTSGEC